MNLRPFFCYFGGKWRAAPKYPPPEHPQIVEPFAGAAGYSTRYHDRKILLVEKDAKIAALWRFLISVSPQEIRAIPLLEKDQTVDDLRVCEEAKILVGFWLNAATTHPAKTPSPWMFDGNHNTNFWGPPVRERIASQVEQIRHWQILEGSYETAPSLEATWFLDPPYQRAGKKYRCHKVDFEHLAEWSRQRRGFTMVCENVGAEWLPFEPFLVLRSLAGRRGGRDSQEALWQQRTGLLEWIRLDYASARAAHAEESARTLVEHQPLLPQAAQGDAWVELPEGGDTDRRTLAGPLRALPACTALDNDSLARSHAREPTSLQGRRHDGPSPAVEAPAWRQGGPP